MVRCRRAQFISGDKFQLSQRWCPKGREWQPYGLEKKKKRPTFQRAQVNWLQTIVLENPETPAHRDPVLCLG